MPAHPPPPPCPPPHSLGVGGGRALVFGQNFPAGIFDRYFLRLRPCSIEDPLAVRILNPFSCWFEIMSSTFPKNACWPKLACGVLVTPRTARPQAAFVTAAFALTIILVCLGFAQGVYTQDDLSVIAYSDAREKGSDGEPWMLGSLPSPKSGGVCGPESDKLSSICNADGLISL